MKKFLLILLLLIIVLPAYSDATWQEIQSKNKILYIDTSSISNQDMTYVVPDSDAQTVYNYICNIHKQTQSEANKKKNSVTPNKLFNTINSINNASYEVRSIKNNALNIINGF